MAHSKSQIKIKDQQIRDLYKEKNRLHTSSAGLESRFYTVDQLDSIIEAAQARKRMMLNIEKQINTLLGERAKLEIDIEQMEDHTIKMIDVLFLLRRRVSCSIPERPTDPYLEMQEANARKPAVEEAVPELSNVGEAIIDKSLESDTDEEEL
ncbi:hypothetical protein OPT61_g3772 [Boeremia exigua]|uniref:Uncharacterized protein n=1 Tax=Boeremia exigua TaxID=749465 RepID=A0ACC2IGR1_9PLEO|nr:hypothetical protein OPT61_g3772 [Boeremia exigua]